MNRRKKYRIFVLWCLVLDLLAMAYLGFRYYDRKIPDEIHITKGQELDVTQIINSDSVTFEEAIAVSQEGSYTLKCSLFGLVPFKEIKVTPVNEQEVCVSGSTVGIYMETEGVLIIDTDKILSEDGSAQDPAKNIVKPGDYIVAFNNRKINSKQDLINDLEELHGEDVILEVKREGETVPVSLTPVKDMKGEYKLGIWVRDDTQGIGTLTYVEDNGNYGALGHGISDVDTSDLLDIRDGLLYKAQILSVTRGTKGSPGELSGLIRYDLGNILGTICQNTSNGIYGRMKTMENSNIYLQRVPVAYKQEIRTGNASILCCVDGSVKTYKAQITRIDMNHEDSNKSFVIQVTDEELLQKTGGIVQGMSGSPVLQNGKFIGAVTHVFVQDPTSGYGIFAETMLENM